MKIKFNAWPRLALLLCVGMCCCKSNAKKETGDDLLTLYPLKNSTTVTDLSRHVADIQIVPLEVTDSSLFSYPTKMLLTSDGKIVLNTDGGILVFAPDGKFLHSIGRRGRGPGEYLTNFDICLDANEKQLYVMEPMNCVTKYNLSDRCFAGKVTLKAPEENYTSIGIFPAADEGFYITYDNPTWGTDMETVYYSLLRFNRAGECVEKLLPRIDYIIGRELVTQTYNNEYFLRSQEGDNVVYKTDNDTMKAFVKIDFEDRAIPRHHVMPHPESGFDIQKFMMADYYKLPIYIHTTDDLIAFTCCAPQAKEAYYLFNLKNGKGINWGNGSEEDSAPIRVIGADREYIYCIYDDYEEYDDAGIKRISNPLKRCILEKTRLVLKDEHQNPVIVKVKFNL